MSDSEPLPDAAPIPVPPQTSPEMPPPMPPPRSRWRRVAGAYVHRGALGALGLIALGLVLDALATPPGPAPLLVLAADVPFLVLVLRAPGDRWKRWTFLWALLHFALGAHWLGRVHPAQVAGAAFGLAPVYLAAGFAIRFLHRRRMPLGLVVPIVLVLEEWTRTWWLGGMPLPSRALPLASFPPLVAATAYLGAYALVFLVGLVNVAALLGAHPWVERLVGTGRRLTVGRAPFVRSALAAACVAVALVLGGHSRLAEAETALVDTSPRVLVAVQGNISQSLKHSAHPHAAQEVFDTHLDLSVEGMRAARDDGGVPTAVLWPETMVPWPFVDVELAHRYPEEWENQTRVLRHVREAAFSDPAVPHFFLGLIWLFQRGNERWVSVFDHGDHDALLAVDPRGISEPGTPYLGPPPLGEEPAWYRGRHDKHVLVPGGEYTPLGDVLPPLRLFRNLVSVIPELDPGAQDQAPLELFPASEGAPAVTAGTVICFELLFPARCRAWRRAGAQVLLNTANYGWFGPSAFLPQIRAVAALRAAETGTTVVVAGNTGPTVFFDPRGRAYGAFQARALVGSPAPTRAAAEGGSAFQEGWAWGPLRLETEETPYTFWGDLPWWGLGILVSLVGILRTPRPHDGSVTVGSYDEDRTEDKGEIL